MSTTTPHRGTEADTQSRPTVVDRAQYGLAAFLVIVGAYTLYDATGIQAGFADQSVAPSFLPYVYGGALILLGVLLAVATRRGDVAEGEDGEDVDLSQRTDLRTIGLLVAVFVANIALIGWLGWAITGALLFAASAWVLGSRTWIRDLAIGAALSLGSFYGFYVGLGIPMPAGILDGIL